MEMTAGWDAEAGAWVVLAAPEAAKAVATSTALKRVLSPPLPTSAGQNLLSPGKGLPEVGGAGPQSIAQFPEAASESEA